MLCRVHKLFSELRNEFSLTPSHATFASLINVCARFKSFAGAKSYWSLYCKFIDEQKEGQRRDVRVYAAMICADIDKTDLSSAVQRFAEMSAEEHLQPNAFIVAKVLSGFAAAISRSKKVAK